jgi:hypothetical protein
VRNELRLLVLGPKTTTKSKDTKRPKNSLPFFLFRKQQKQQQSCGDAVVENNNTNGEY